MSNTLRIKRRAAGGSPGSPAALKNGELAFNEQDDVLYYGKGDTGGGNASSIIPIGGPGAFLNALITRAAGTVLAAPSGSTGAPTFRALVASDVPTLNQDTTGTSANVTGVVEFANGGTGQAARQDAINALVASTSAGMYLRGNGTNVVMAALAAADLTGTIPGAVLGNSVVYIGTTAVPLNRASGALTLTGVSGVGGGGSTPPTRGVSLLDFGAFPGSNVATVTVTGQTGILDTDVARASVNPDSTSPDHTANDHLYANLFLRVGCETPVTGVGFTIHAVSSEKLTGQFSVNWEWQN